MSDANEIEQRYVQVPPYACLWPVDPAVAAYPDWSGLGGAPIAPVLAHRPACRPGDGSKRLGWSCAALPAVSERLHHILHHMPESRWDVPRVLAVGIASPHHRSEPANRGLQSATCGHVFVSVYEAFEQSVRLH